MNQNIKLNLISGIVDGFSRIQTGKGIFSTRKGSRNMENWEYFLTIFSKIHNLHKGDS